MATGACGICCDVCQLNLLGHCSSCGPGRSELAARKSAAQQRILGQPCAILACARLNHIDYCPRDCMAFPCDNFSRTGYPYSQGFLSMQARRRSQGPPARAPDGRPIQIDPTWWERLAQRDLDQVANFTLTDTDGASGQLRFAFLNRLFCIDTTNRCLREKAAEGWKKRSWPLLELVVLDYFGRVDRLYPMGQEMIGTDDHTEAHYFSGRGQLQTEALLTRFGSDPEDLIAVGERLGGQAEQMADAAVQLRPLPRIPVYYLLWLGSEEYASRISILFDRSIEKSLSPPAIWSLVQLCSYFLIKGG